MSVGPLGGVLGSAAGAPLSQTKGAATETSAREASARDQADEIDLRAERSSGVGQTEGDEGASDRDADGRRLWERQQQGRGGSPDEEAAGEQDEGPPSDEGGDRLDLIA